MKMKIQMYVILMMMMMKRESYAANLIETTCKNTPNYQLCINTLRGSPESATADVAGLALIMVDAVKGKTEQALSTVNKSAQPKLQRCTNYYNAVLKADVPMAEAALRKGDPKFAEQGMSDAATEADLCERTVAPSPLSAVNKDLRDLALVATAIIRNLL